MFFWKQIITLVMCLMVCATSASAQKDSSPKSADLELERLKVEMLANNHGLKALEQKVDALKQEVQAAGALDDPRLGFGLLNLPSDSFRFDEQPMTQKQVTLAQRIPWFGKRDLKTQRAVLNALKQESVLKAQRLKLILTLIDTYYQLGFVVESLGINERLTNHIDQIVRSQKRAMAPERGCNRTFFKPRLSRAVLWIAAICSKEKGAPWKIASTPC